MIIQNTGLSHRKTVSNNPVGVIQAKNYKQNVTPQSKKYQATQDLINRLANLQVLRNIHISTQKTQKTGVSNTKTRIRTEGNEKNSFHTLSLSMKKNRIQRNSNSPQQKNQDISYLQQLMRSGSNSQNRQKLQQSEFQQGQKKQQQINSQQRHFQRHGLSQCSSALELMQKQQEQLRPSQSTKQLNQHWLTTKQFKDKLSSLSKERQIKQNQSIIQTEKKQCYDEIESFYQRSRTETEQTPSRQSYILDNEYQIVKTKRLETKIDILVEQVSKLNKKSEQLEISNQQGNSEHNFVQVHTAEMEKDYTSKQSLKKSLISSKIYKQYSYRWVIMIFYQAAIFLNGMAYETCIPNTIQFSQLYNVSDQVITATATVYMLMHPLLTFIASSVIVNKGFAYSVNLGAISTIIGFAIRLLINKSSFYFVILGQVFTGFGRPFILNAQATMAQNWFYPSNRTAILTISNTIQTLSIVASLLMPANLFFRDYQYNENNKEEGLQISYNLMFFQFIMSLLLIPGVFLLRSNAPTPPSGFANTDKDISFKQAVLKLFKNKNFNIIFITFSIYFGNLKGFGLIVPYLMKPFGFLDSQYSITGSMVILGGLISSAFISKIVLLFKKYKMICAILMSASIFACGFLYIALTTELIQMVYGVAFVLGFFLVPLAPVLLEYGCEAIYPINGSFAVGLLISGATLLTVVSSQVLTAVVNGKNSDSQSVLLTIVVMISTLVGGLVLFFFSKEILNRTQEVRARSILQKSAFFKSKVLKQSIKNEDFKNRDDLKQGIGDYPTDHPFIDPHRFIANPEVFNPDVVADLEEDDDNK